MKFHHIGLAVSNISKELLIYGNLGAKQETEIIKDDGIGVNVCFINLGGLRLELVSPLGKNSPVEIYLKKNIRMYHKCFEVESMVDANNVMKNAGAIRIMKPQPAIAFDGRLVCFYMLRNKDMIEVLEMT